MVNLVCFLEKHRMKVEIICPLYNAATYILKLHASLLAQKNVDILKISYVMTESSDETEKSCKRIIFRMF